MTKNERVLRYALALEHHNASGIRIEEDDARMRCFLNDTACIPLSIYKLSLRASRQVHEGGFPPTSGQVIHAARVICLHGESRTYHPRWYARVLAGKLPEYEGVPALPEGKNA